jgi:hypothetical protein
MTLALDKAMSSKQRSSIAVLDSYSSAGETSQRQILEQRKMGEVNQRLNDLLNQKDDEILRLTN